MMSSRSLTATVLIFLLLFLSACNDAEEKKIKHYKRALEYIKLEDRSSAAIELKNAIQIDPKYSDARYQLGLIYLEDGDPRGAFGELQRTVTLDPTNLDAGVKVAEFFLLSRDHDQCRKYVEQVLAQDPEYRDGLALLANLELIEGNFDAARQAIDKAIAKEPDNDKLLNIQGRVLVAQGDAAGAEQRFLKAIELQPDNFANYRTLLMHYEQSKKTKEMAELLDTMTEKFPDNHQLSIMLARIYEKKGEIGEAEAAILAAIKNQQQLASLRVLLSEFYKRHNQYEKAKETLATAVAEFPEEVQLKINLADLQFDLRNFDEANKLMEQILTSNPGNGGGNLLKARFLIRDRQYNDALNILTPLMSDYPKWAEPFYYSALVQLRLGKTELALKAIESALKNNPMTDRFHALAAQINLVGNDTDAASKEATIALRLNPRNMTAAKILAGSYAKAKEWDKTIKILTLLDENDAARDEEILGTLGMAYLGIEDKEKAKETFTRLLDLQPQNTKALAMLTAINFGKDVAGALAFVEKHTSQHPAAENYLLLGDLFIRNRQFDQALRSFDKARELDPANPEPYIQSARLLAGLGKTGETEQQYNQLLTQNPDSIPGLMGIASIYEQTGRLAEAKEKYQRVLQLRPNIPAAANNLAWIIASEENGDLGEALRLAMAAKQALPSQPHVADTLGWVHYKRNSFSLAITQFKQALENSPNDPNIRYHLALAQYANGEKQHAIAELEKVLGENNTLFVSREEAKQQLQVWQAEQ